ncbi:MAG: response regulator [Treponema sp.]|nr:response regulator [Treponema sp.]
MYSVLIVEDDPMVAMINEQYVTRNGNFTVVGHCRNGQEALDFLDKQVVDLLILDVYMPYMNGVEVLHRIRDRHIQTEAIMVTAANDTVTLDDTMHLGVIDYLVKPFAFDRFQIALEKYCNKVRTLKNAQVLDQHNIDSIISNLGTSKEKQYPKGIQEKTLALILNNLDTATGWLDGDTIAKNARLSSVTVRRYMNYLVESGSVLENINYDTGGRPSMLYKKKDH